MLDLVKLSTARELVLAGAVQQAQVIGLPGGWTVQLQTLNQPRVLATKANEPRRFGSFESAVKVLRDLGVRLDLLQVDAAHWDADDRPATKRPDRSAAMKQKDADARYAAHLRDAVLQARADNRPSVPAARAKQHMDAIKTKQQAQLVALAKSGRA